MSECLSFIMAPWGKYWKRASLQLSLKVGSLPFFSPAVEIDVPYPESPRSEDDQSSTSEDASRRVILVKKTKPLTSRHNVENVQNGQASTQLQMSKRRYISNGGSNKFSLFTKQGRKGINQDAMLAWEKLDDDVVFCGVFDGHGRDGHLVARSVRDKLPEIVADAWSKSQPQISSDDSELQTSSDESESDSSNQQESDDFESFDPSPIIAWKESFVTAYKVMDRELINGNFDCISSGTTAVLLVKQGKDVIVGNVGDSRAVLGTRGDDNSMLALQLTVDSKPNEPREAERIKKYKGRIFPLPNEPSVHRVWLPRQAYARDSPGLAMARAFGDYCLKNHGVISEPEVTYKRLSHKDEFVVLATDGVWDVLTNEQVVDIVASTADRSSAARAVVDCAVKAWKSKPTFARVDDCAVVCLFMD